MSKFSDHVTSTAFSLNLSKSQVAAIGYMANDDIEGFTEDRSGIRNTKATLTALVDKGIKYHGQFKLTPEGKLVADLLKMAGLIG